MPETITWYTDRSRGGWQWVALLLFGLNFALPFALLLSRFTKRRIDALARVAIIILAMRLVDLFWVIAPKFHAEVFHVHWLDVAAPAGIGGVWVWFFLNELHSHCMVIVISLSAFNPCSFIMISPSL